ncbi:hypothetical protein TA3x_004045 [Tundrisphaera sp. TA3]|uniref:hypothetical protein n=1 Tax=Tundrisphaera sp. TA3 TaxID=3435775 RepID=UPI003EB84CF8
MRHTDVRGLRLGATIAVCLALAGCTTDESGDSLDREAVSGKVTLDGQPLDSAVIQFISTDPNSQGGTSGPIKAGAYEFGTDRGPVAGSYKVAISSVEPTVEEAEPPPPGEVPKPKPDRIPKKYNVQTTLTAEIKAGESNAIDFALDSKK